MITNSVTGDTIHFWSSPMLGDGAELVFRTTLPAFAIGAPAHVHEAMSESFEVESGTLAVDLGKGETRLLGPGERIELAPGTPHGFHNPTAQETIFVTAANPGLELERFLRAMYAMANSGLTDANGAPRNPLAMAAVLAHVDMILAGVPRGLQRALVGPLAALARLTGTAALVAQLAGEETA